MSIISPSTPGGRSLFCDDVRQEDNGKQIIIGLYSSEMLVDTFPIILPSFRVLVRYEERIGESDLPVKLTIVAPSGPDESEILIFQVDLPRESFETVTIPLEANDDPIIAAQIFASFSPIVFTHSGRIKVRAFRGEDEIRLGTLRVRLRSEWEEEQHAAMKLKEAAN